MTIQYEWRGSSFRAPPDISECTTHYFPFIIIQKKAASIPTEAALLETCSNIPNSKPNLMLYLANLNSILYRSLSLDSGLLTLP